MIDLTENAARQIRALVEEKSAAEGAGLRLQVEKGGCAGFQYAMSLAEPEEGDHIVQRGDARLFVDPDSLAFLDGCVLDYQDELSGAGFRVQNPNAVRSCGCGTSFETQDSSA